MKMKGVPYKVGVDILCMCGSPLFPGNTDPNSVFYPARIRII
jgi:hypothetical protein